MERSQPPFSDADVKELLERLHSTFEGQSEPRPTAAELQAMQSAAMVDNPDQYFRIAHDVARPQAEAQVSRQLAAMAEKRKLERTGAEQLGRLGLHGA